VSRGFATSILRRVTNRRAFMLGAATALGASHTGWAQQPDAAPRQRVVKIALPQFNAESGDVADLAREITALITDDLRSAGGLTLIDSAAPPTTAVDSVPPFDTWRAQGVEALIIGGIKTATDGRLRAQFRLWDVAAGMPLAGQQYFTLPERWQQLAHVIASAVYERLVGEARDFETQRD
jgi:TolB protein